MGCIAVVDVPKGSSATFIQSSLAQQHLLMEHMNKTVSKMPGIQTVRTGAVKTKETNCDG